MVHDSYVSLSLTLSLSVAHIATYPHPTLTPLCYSGEPYLKRDPMTKIVTKTPNRKRLQREMSLVKKDEY
jgi:hypothetical protein